MDDRVKLLCKSLLACLISAYGASPFLFFPPTLAAPLSTTSICLLSDAAVNGQAYWDNAKKRVQGAKDWAGEAYVPREGEVAQRIGQNTALTALGIGVAIGVLWGVYSLIQHVSSQNVSVWDAYRLLPNQTPTIVFMEYAFLGVLHGLLAMKKGGLKDKQASSFHLMQAVMSLIFPLFYLCNATTAEPMRLHHSFIGIALALLPFNSLKAFGTTISLDSALYFLSPWRGHGTESYDFMNFFLEHGSTYVSALSGLCGVEYTIDRTLPKEEKDRENQELENGLQVEPRQFVPLQESLL